MSENLRIAVLGSAGQFGTDLVDVLRAENRFDVVPLSHADCDCASFANVSGVLGRLHPDIVVNSAAYIRVDECEDHAREAFEVNAIGALNVARVCAGVGGLCVYISTDYVFDGIKSEPYVESDATNPINVYGTSKLAGEILVRQTAPRWLIIRLASLFGKSKARGKNGNFVETILAKADVDEPIKIVNDVRMSPTFSRDAAVALVRLFDSGADGIVHLTNQGSCSWYEFAKTALELAGRRLALAPVSSTDYPTRAHRPKNSALTSERSEVKLPFWRDGLKAYLLDKAARE